MYRRVGRAVVSGPVDPWSETLSASWRPELCFYERRTELLRALDDLQRLRAFKVREDSVRGLLGPKVEVILSAGGLEVVTQGPDPPTDDARVALDLAFEIIAPRRLVAATVLLQFIVPLDQDYETVKARAARDAAVTLIPGLPLTDFSFLADGYEEHCGATWQVEMGIIDRSEAIDRVMRARSRIQAPGGPSGLRPPTEEAFPDVAFFSDWYWSQRWRDAPEAPLVEVRDLWATARADSMRYVEDAQLARLGNLPTTVEG